MKLLLMIVLSTFKPTIIIASCPDDTEPSFCQSHDTIPQLYCGNVDLEDEWQCRKRSYAKCVCTAGLYRRRDGACVPLEQCEDEPKKPGEPSSQEPPKYPNIPEQLQGSEEDLNKVLKLVRRNETMLLLMVNKDDLPYILKDYEVCLKSTFIKFTATGAMRTMVRYKDVELIDAHLSMVVKQGEADFQVVIEYQRLYLVIDFDKSGRAAEESNKYDLRDEFIVLAIGDNCLLVSYGSWRNGRPDCMLWGFNTENTKATACFPTVREICSTDTVELWAEGGSCRVTDALTNGDTSHDQNQGTGSKLPLTTKINAVTTYELLQFLRQKGNIHLQMMDESDYVKNDCECITSAFEVVKEEGSMRTLECYVYTEILELSKITNKIIKMPKMTKIKQSVYFQVKDIKGVKFLELSTIVDGAPINHPPKYISSNYVIAKASTDCLLLSYGPSSNGRRKCMLWGLSRQEVNIETTCYKEAQSLCEEDIYDITEAESMCDHYDREEKNI